MTTISRTSTLILMAAMTLAACHRAKPTLAVSASPERNTATDNSDRDRLERERLERERAERDRLARERADRDRALAELRRAMSAPIYFEFDRSDLPDSARSTLEAQAKILSANPLMHMLDPARVAVTSFGEEPPTCREETPDCRALNRRDDVRITSGDPTTSGR